MKLLRRAKMVSERFGQFVEPSEGYQEHSPAARCAVDEVNPRAGEFLDSWSSLKLSHCC